MNSVDRLLTALKGGKPDRVPVWDSLIDPAVWRNAIPEATDAADFMDRAGYDAVCCGATFEHVEEFADGSYTDEWGVLYKPGPEALDHPVSGPVADLDDARAWQPPSPDAPQRLAKLRDLVDRYQGRRAVVFHHRAAFMWSAYLAGLDNLLMAFAAEPDFADYLLDKVLDVNMALVREAIRAGAEVIVLGDDYAHNRGPMMSPAAFDRFIAPRLARMIAMIHSHGALCIKHSDGNLYAILDSIVAAGPDGLNPVEPVAGMTLTETRRRVGPHLCLVGNVDCGRLLPFGTPAAVREAVRQAIADGGRDGAFILSSSNSIHSSCRPENVMAMLDAAREFGTYA